MAVRLSASLLYCFSSLTLGNAAGARKGVESIRNCLNAAFKEGWDEEIKAVCVFTAYLSTVLLHISPDELPALEDYSKYLPIGLRLYALYILAHEAYLKCDYGRALGMHSLR